MIASPEVFTDVLHNKRSLSALGVASKGAEGLPQARSATVTDLPRIMTSKLLERIRDVDLYELLEVAPDAAEAVIKKAYRKKALICHPDKNPDDPNAADTFRRLTDAVEVLTDADARRAYDNVLKARKANALRNKQLDSKRKKLKDDLESRERNAAASAAFDAKWKAKTEEERLKDEIDRLQKEGSRLIEEEQESMRRIIEEERTRLNADRTFAAANATGKIKLKWGDDGKSSYNEDSLRQIFSKYGDVTHVVVMKRKALVEFSGHSAAESAASYESGFSTCPFKEVKLMGGGANDKKPVTAAATNSFTNNAFDSMVKETDYESLVLHKLRQAEARRKEIERIQAEDEREEREKKEKAMKNKA